MATQHRKYLKFNLFILLASINNDDSLQPFKQPDDILQINTGGRKTPKEPLNIKNAIGKYNVKLNELRRKMYNDNPNSEPFQINPVKEKDNFNLSSIYKIY